MNGFEYFVTRSLIWPALIIAWGSYLALFAHRRRPLPPKAMHGRHRFIRWLATRRWDRPCGIFMVIAGLIILLMHASRP